MKIFCTTKKGLIVVLMIIFSAANIRAQVQPKSVDSIEKKVVVNAVADVLAKQYVFPEMAKKMGDLIRKNLKAGKYAALEDPHAFAMKLSEDLRSVSRDRHLDVNYDPDLILEIKTPDEAKRKAVEEREEKFNRFENYGFKEVKILSGNVGYLKFNQFSAAQEAFSVAVGAMAFLANCDALIIDLCENGGGTPEMVQLLSSYFFSGEPRHLNSFYYRLDEKTVQYWTQPYVPGAKLADTGLYVLTSSHTFSGAEEFTYNLKNMKRATVIGETTGGGAHPMRTEILNDNFIISVPFAQAINPISKTNWEGTGVEPDVNVPAAQALDKAHLLALEKLASNENDERIKSTFQWALDELNAELHPVTVAEDTMKSFAGNYGPGKIFFEDGSLFYQRGGDPKIKMIPLREDYFAFAEIRFVRIKIVRKDGKVTGAEEHYDNGTITAYPWNN